MNNEPSMTTNNLSSAEMQLMLSLLQRYQQSIVVVNNNHISPRPRSPVVRRVAPPAFGSDECDRYDFYDDRLRCRFYRDLCHSRCCRCYECCGR